MGKAQSKRSVDITTETKQEDEVTEKMEKIEDSDRKEVNGDATVDLQNEKKESDDAEVDKDATTEKTEDALAGGDVADQQKSLIVEPCKEEGGTTAEEISPLADDNSKKSKKEKVKKKWSFRSISFGKKDKQKPLKTEESTETAGAITNGTDGETPSQEIDTIQKETENTDKCPDEKSMEIRENGTATESEKTEQQTEVMSSDDKTNEETGKKTIPTAEKSEHLINAAEDITSQETERTSKIPTKPDVVDIENKHENNYISKTSNNERCDEEVNATVNHSTNEKATEEVIADNKNIPADIETVTVNGNVDDIHQNGTQHNTHQDVEDTKAQIEVKSNTDINPSAGSLEIISTCKNPSNDQSIEDVGTEKNDAKETDFESINESRTKTDDQHEEKVELLSVDPEEIFSQSLNESCTKTDHKYQEKVELYLVDPSVEDKFDNKSTPPPLPISPPPSHVTVFAFTNKEETDDSLKNTKSEEVHFTELLKNQCDADASGIENSIADIEDQSNSFQIINNIVSVLETEIQCEQRSSSSEYEIINEDKNIQKDEEKSIVDAEEIELKSNSPTVKEKETADNISFICKLQTECNKIYECDENNVEDLSQNVGSDAVILLDHTIYDLNDINKNEEIIPEHFLKTPAPESCPNTNVGDDRSVHSENESSNQSSKLSESWADDKITQQNIHHETHMHDKTSCDNFENLVREETKEITNIKDLNESATIKEITQDPSITCE